MVTEKIIQQRLDSKSTASSDAEFQEMAEIGADSIKLNDADYKTYLFVAAAFMYGNRRLMNKLNKDLKSAITQIMEISARIATKS